ncbi:MAG TPA: four helix bundle protein [Candidatus Paceibacterota bacterium]
MLTSFKELVVYKDSYTLMILVHKAVKNFPNHEQFDLTSQMRRASKSIPANLAEGWAKREHTKEFIKHLNICIGSSHEMEVHAQTAGDLGYMEQSLATRLANLYSRLSGQLITLKQKWKPIIK